MKTIEKYNFDVCEVTCEYCGITYNTVEYDDEIPTICDDCHTPGLCVLGREPTEFAPLCQVKF